MSDGAELREQLRSLSIPREQRPGARPAAGAAGSWRMLWVMIALIIVGAGGYVGWQKFGAQILALRNPPAPAVQLLKVSRQSEPGPTPLLTATGKIVSDHRVEVSTKVSGQVVELKFEQGDAVKAGQVLARIEDTAYRARRDEALGMLEKARASLAYQEINCERITRLAEQQQASDIELAEARRALAEAHAQVAADEATLAFAQKMFDDCEVLAPISGVILERNVEVGDFVAAEGGRGAMANSQVGAIADMDALRVEVDVSELDIARIHRDIPCIIAPDAYKDRKYHGFVLWIDPGANYAKATVQVKVRIKDPDDRLRVEGAAQVQFLSGAPQSQAATQAAESAGFWIPLSACLIDSDSGRGRVFVARGGVLHEVAVALGERDPGRIRVLSGLTEGDEIAADGLARLHDGQALKP